MDETATVSVSKQELAGALSQLSYPSIMEILEQLADYYSDTTFEAMLYDCAYELRFK